MPVNHGVMSVGPHSLTIPYFGGASSLFLDPCLPASDWRLVTLCSSCSRLGSFCMKTPRVLSLKMAAAIPRYNPPFSVNRVYMHLSHRTNFCR